MKKSIIGAAVAAAALVCSFAVAAEEVHVAVAANFTAPAKDLQPIYEKATGDKLVLPLALRVRSMLRSRMALRLTSCLRLMPRLQPRLLLKAMASPALPLPMQWANLCSGRPMPIW